MDIFEENLGPVLFCDDFSSFKLACNKPNQAKLNSHKLVNFHLKVQYGNV